MYEPAGDTGEPLRLPRRLINDEEVFMINRSWRRRGLTGAALLLGIFGLTACASKRYVSEEVSKSSATSEKRINEVESQVEATQSKVREHDTKLAELDKTTRDALERAEAAGKLAEGKFVYSLVLSDDAVKFPDSCRKWQLYVWTF